MIIEHRFYKSMLIVYIVFLVSLCATQIDSRTLLRLSHPDNNKLTEDMFIYSTLGLFRLRFVSDSCALRV